MRVVSSLLEYYRVASHVDEHQHARRNISEAQCLDSHKSPQAPGKNQLRVKNLKIKVMASQSIIGEKSLAFAKRIARCYVYLKKKGETVMSKQLLRSGTSVGANRRSSEHNAMLA